MPLGLLNPGALWLLALATIPLLLARRRTRPPRIVGNLYLWREAVPVTEERIAPRRRRPSVLTVVQILSIGFAAIALAGPTLALRGGRAAVVIDLSASMAARNGGTTRLAEGLGRARAVIDGLAAGTRVRLITAAARPDDRGEYDARDPRLRRLLETLTPTSGAADVAGAVRMARADGRDVFVVSDAPPSGAAPAAQTATWIQVGGAAENVAITQLAARPVSIGADAGDVLVEVRNFGAVSQDVRMALAVDDHRVGLYSVHVDAGSARTVTTRLAALGRVVSARLLSGDALPLDDVRFALVPHAVRARVALVGSPESFVARALAVNPTLSVDIVSTVPPTAALSAFDVVVCDGCTTAPMGARRALLMYPADPRAPSAPLSIVEDEHPLAASLDVAAQAAAPVPGRPVDPAEIVVRAGALPVVTAHERDGIRVAEVRLDLTRGDFALTPAFPVLVADALRWLTTERYVSSAVIAGEPLRVGTDAIAGASLVRVVGPDGRRREVRRSGGELVVLDTTAAGVYRVRDQSEERLFVVNPAVDTESDLRTAVLPARVDGSAGAMVRLEPFSLAPVYALLAAVALVIEWRMRHTSAV